LEEIELFKEAGSIARRVRARAERLVVEGIKVIEICEELEEMIRAEGAEPAFPCNVGVNEVAAHYTAIPGDPSIIPPRSIVKVDIGVSLDGYIADTATTVVLNPELSPLAEAARAALHQAIKAIRPGVKVSMIGAAVQKTLSSLGFKPIRNLTGHEIKRYNLHAGLTIPNVAVPSPGRIEEGHVYAIEPFATTMRGAGEVVSLGAATIFRADPRKLKVRGLKGEELELLKMLVERFDNLPYTPRWVQGFERLKELHERLVKLGRVHGYPVLVERRGAPVDQFEHTVLVGERGCEIIT